MERLKQVNIDSCARPLFDMYIWNHANRNGWNRLFVEGVHSIGMKGLPGRPGVVPYHRNPKNPGVYDPEWLEGIIGADAEYYKRFIKSI